MNDPFNSLVAGIAASILVLTLLIGWLTLFFRHRKWRQSKITMSVCAVIILATLVSSVVLWHKPVTIVNISPATAEAIYNQSTSGNLVLFDPLTAQDNNNWDTGTWNTFDSCSFTTHAYHIKLGQPNYYGWCIAETPIFRNFAFQVQVTILKGDGGGVLFRSAGKQGKYYAFSLTQDGNYELTLYRDETSFGQQPIQNGSSPAIKTGENQTNLVTVIANGGNIYIYVNKHNVVSINDSTYSAGQIGLVADEDSEPTDVAFQNVQVWTL